MRLPTVLLADDHALFTEGLVNLLKARFDVVATVRDGHALVDQARHLRPDIVISDVSMPEMSGFQALRRLKELGVATRIILLTMHADPRLATEALRAGAAGFVLKQSTGDELVQAMHEVLQGRTYLSPAITRDVVALLSTAPDPGEVHLTVRQREILQLIVEGRRMKEVAAALDISRRTAENIKYDLMRSLDLHSTAELVRYAIQHNLVRL